MLNGNIKKIKDLTYYDYGSMIAVGYKDVANAIGSDNEELLKLLNSYSYNVSLRYDVKGSADDVQYISENASPKSLWFKTERELINFLVKAEYITKKEAFVQCL